MEIFDTYSVWKYVHIMMLTFWLGTDMGVLMTTKKSADPSLDPVTRFKMVEMALLIELLPRFMWTFAFAFGMHLSRAAGYVDVSDTTMIVVWVITAIVFITNVGSAFLIGKPLGEKLLKLNNYVIPAFGAGIFIVGAMSYFGDGPFTESWLGLKLMIFGIINISAISILWVFEPAFVFYLRLLEEGSTPEIEAGIKKGISKTLISVYTTYILIALVAFMGVFKPF